MYLPTTLFFNYRTLVVAVQANSVIITDDDRKDF